ncbi:hypothetical protein L1049_023164 [Liquidambar formosana]|uniref:Uncharacterized protein n=1 Tax=Liquidambar formosana TaxID=63359 RepID=A0AAP0WSX4_LIQFO
MGSEKKSSKEEKKKHKKRSSPSASEDEGRSKRRKTVEDEERKRSKSDKKEKRKSKKSHKHSKHHSDKEKKSGDKHKDKHHKRDRHSTLEFQELSNDDYFLKNNEFATWLKDERKIFFSDLSSSLHANSSHTLSRTGTIKSLNPGTTRALKVGLGQRIIGKLSSGREKASVNCTLVHCLFCFVSFCFAFVFSDLHLEGTIC